MKKYDVIVAGGGFAGVAAAIAARREGASVLLIEKGNCLGGAASHALVNPFMNMGTRLVYQGKNISAYGGIFRRIHKKLLDRDAMGGTGNDGFLEEELKLILNRMVIEAGVELLYHATVFAVKTDGERICSLSLATRGQNLDAAADFFIDCTGDAQIAYLAGCPCHLGRDGDNLCQPMTLCFRIGNVDMEKFLKSRARLKEAHKKALEEGALSNPRENILLFEYPIKNVLHMNTTRIIKLDPTNPEELTRAEIIGREQVFEIYEFMKKHADGLENSFIMSTAAEIGIRESRMIDGDYLLTGEDCKSCKKFDDAISACNYCIDIHNPEGTGTEIYDFKDGEFYTIPYRSLIPKGVSNMLVAGRCISSDHTAQASYRVMPSVCCIGEAAGIAAGIAFKNGGRAREISINELQQKIISYGGYIGQ